MLKKTKKRKSIILLVLSVLLAGVSITLCFSHNVFLILQGIAYLIFSIVLFSGGLDVAKLVNKKFIGKHEK